MAEAAGATATLFPSPVDALGRRGGQTSVPTTPSPGAWTAIGMSASMWSTTSGPIRTDPGFAVSTLR